ncbi:MAG: hypothetical protein NTY35_13065 [Planctomycetota bacterium]|nr:hypothetical protein [Planctomycetota bacterium]
MIAGLLLVLPEFASASTAPAVRPEEPAATSAPAQNGAEPADAARARRAYALLKASERKDVADFLESELEHLPTFQMTLARWVLEHQDRDPLAWASETEAPYFDPARHAPAQPIARHRLAPNDPRAVAARRDLRVPLDPRAWTYDWSSGAILHRVEADTTERAFELALRGLPPRFDLVLALVERALDDGSQRKAHAAFAHAYTDRAGLVYPGITLYDAWKSGAEIEMPDVDCLGIVNTLLDDWTTWTSVVPGNKQDALYARIAELFQPVHRQRELRAAIAATFLQGAPDLCCGYEGSIDNFHALWEDCESTPANLGKRLPDAAGWTQFLADWVAECHRRGELFQRGVARRATLAAEGAEIRATLLRVLEEYGAFARLREATGTKDENRSQSGR